MTIGRFVHTHAPALQPGHCILCRNTGAEHGYADSGVSDEWMGAFYICFPCVREMSELWGAQYPEQVAELVQENQALRDQLSAALGELTALQDLRNVIKRFKDVDSVAGGSRNAVRGGRRGGNRRPSEQGEVPALPGPVEVAAGVPDEAD